jgi:hypothetical protein
MAHHPPPTCICHPPGEFEALLPKEHDDDDDDDNDDEDEGKKGPEEVVIPQLVFRTGDMFGQVRVVHPPSPRLIGRRSQSMCCLL